MVRRLAAAATAAVFLGTVVAPSLVLASGQPPSVPDVHVTTAEDTPISGNLWAPDADPESDSLVVVSHGQFNAGLGWVSINNSTGAFTFTPTADASGSGWIPFSVSDGTTTVFSTLIVTVTAVNDAPACSTPVASSGNEDAQQSGTLHCTDAEHQSLTYTLVAAAAHGTAAVQANGAWTYTPTGDWSGSDSFTFKANDGSLDSNVATMNITVNAVNDVPVCPADSATIAEDGVATGSEVCTDVEGSPLTYAKVANPAHGTAVVDADGSWTYDPAPNYHGSDSFTYKANDGTGDSAAATISITITSVNDDPVVEDGTVTISEDDAADVTDQVLDLATDADLDSLSVSDVSNATGGEVELAAGVVTFTPDEDLCGAAAGGFDFEISDGNGGTGTGHATVDITCVNDAPIAPDETGTAGENQSAKAFDVLADASDADDGDTLTIDSASVDPSQGTVTVSGGKVWFTPAHDFVGDAEISYTITDGTDDATGTLTVTVSPDVTGPSAVAPTIAFGTGRVDETAPLVLTWSASDISGISAYQVEVSVAGGAFTPVYSGTGTTTTKFYALNKALVWRVRAQDGVGNWSDWAVSTSHKIVAYQAPGNSSISFSGTWTTVSSTGSSGTGYKYVTALNKYAQLKFTGMSVLYVAPKLSIGGYVKVYVDNVLVGKYSTYKSSTALGQIIARKSWGSSGSHTIKIVDAQSGRRIGLDAFLVLR